MAKNNPRSRRREKKITSKRLDFHLKQTEGKQLINRDAKREKQIRKRQERRGLSKKDKPSNTEDADEDVETNTIVQAATTRVSDVNMTGEENEEASDEENEEDDVEEDDNDADENTTDEKENDNKHLNFGKKLAHSEKKIRDKGFKALAKWLKKHPELEAVEYLRFCFGLIN